MAHETHRSLKEHGKKSHESKVREHMSAGGDIAQDRKMIEKAVRAHENHDHPGKPHTKLKLKSGGSVDGEPSKQRLDRAKHAKGGAAKEKGNHVNVIVAGGGPKPMPIPMPVGGGPGMPPPGAGMGAPPAPPMAPRPPMGPMAGGMPPGAMGAGSPMMRKAGGRVDMDAGSGSALGRLEKMKDYGKKAPVGENKDLTGDDENEAFTGDDENKSFSAKG